MARVEGEKREWTAEELDEWVHNKHLSDLRGWQKMDAELGFTTWAEYSTAGDKAVCRRCAKRDGRRYDLAAAILLTEARICVARKEVDPDQGCRCTWMPWTD